MSVLTIWTYASPVTVHESSRDHVRKVLSRSRSSVITAVLFPAEVNHNYERSFHHEGVAFQGIIALYEKRRETEKRKTYYESATNNESVSIVSAILEVVSFEILENPPSRAFACSLPFHGTRGDACGHTEHD